jgi:adenine deaminase
LEVSKLDKCKTAIEKDPIFFGIDCVKGLLQYEEIIVEHSTDVSRIKNEASNTGVADFYAFVNANILTMTTDSEVDSLIRGGIVSVRGGVIEHVGSFDEVMPLLDDGVTVMDAQGGFILPGFIDMHAHWEGVYATMYNLKVLTFIGIP